MKVEVIPMSKIRIGIAGYGNLGKGVELAIRQNDDMELAGVFTRRAPESVKLLTAGIPVYPIADIESHKDEIDVLIICGGSATDLPVQTPALAEHFNVIDSFDTHARMAGIRVCSPSTVCMRRASCATAQPTPSGARAFLRVTPMRSAVSRA